MKISCLRSRRRGRDWIQGNRIPFDSGRIEVDRSDHGERSWWNVRRVVAGELCKVDTKRNLSQRNPVTFARRYENPRHVQPYSSELNFTNRSSRSARWASYCKSPLPPRTFTVYTKNQLLPCCTLLSLYSVFNFRCREETSSLIVRYSSINITSRQTLFANDKQHQERDW